MSILSRENRLGCVLLITALLMVPMLTGVWITTTTIASSNESVSVFMPPYDKCYSRTYKILGNADVTHRCEKNLGYIVTYSYAGFPLGGSSCEALQGLKFYIGNTKSLSFDIEFIYNGGTEVKGVGAFALTNKRCYIDIYSDDDYEDVIVKSIHPRLSWSSVLNQLVSMISFVDNPGKYTTEMIIDALYSRATRDQLYDALINGSETKHTHLCFNYTFPPGWHTIFSGFDIAASASYLSAHSVAVMIGQIKQITIYGIDPPDRPSIEGQHIADVGEPLEFCFNSSDKNGDNIRYKVDWGDGQTEPWTDFLPNNYRYTTSHCYSNSGEYHITVQVQDNDFDGSKIARHTIMIIDENVSINITPVRQKIYPNESFEIKVYADSGEFGINSVSTNLYYNQSVFRVKNYTIGNILESDFPLSPPYFSDANGHIFYEIKTIPSLPPFPPASGLILSIEFEVICGIAGSTHVIKCEGILKDEFFSSALINLTSNNAYIEILDITEPEYVYIELYPSWQTILPGESFTINASLYPNDNIAGVQFDLAFDSSKINANEIIIGDFFENYSSYFNAGNINNIKGTITGVYNVITTPGASAITPGTIATINFTANDYDGILYLNLSNIIIGGPEGSTVPIISRNAIIEISNPSDINKDERINILDLIIIGQHWSETGSPGWISADVNCDGMVNILDMILVGQYWTG